MLHIASEGVPSSGSNYVTVPRGVTSVMVSWAGEGETSLQIRDATNAIIRRVYILRDPSKKARTIMAEIPAEVEGFRITFAAVSATQEDVDTARLSVRIIPTL